MSRWWALLALCGILAPSNASILERAVRKPGGGPYFRIHRGTLWGFMDDSGKTVIEPQFEEVGDFFAGLARVWKKDKWGYIDLTGRLAIPYRFDDAGDFVEGLAPVKFGRGWGIIDPTGKFVVQPHLGAIAEFSDGLARFEDWEQIQCIDVDRERTYTKDDAPDFAFMIHDGSGDDMGFIPCRGQAFGFLDHAGNVVIPSQFEYAEDFSEDRAVIRRDGRYGYIDKAGKIVVEPQFDHGDAFSEGSATVRVGNDQTGVIDKAGQFVIPAEFYFIGRFSEGLASACIENQRCGFIDHKGRLVVPPRFIGGKPFSEGLSLVWSNDTAGPYFVDHVGKKVLEPGWTAWSFSGGLTVVALEDRYAYVDHDGKIIGTYENFRGSR